MHQSLSHLLSQARLCFAHSLLDNDELRPDGFVLAHELVDCRGAILFPKFIGAAAGALAGLIGLSVLEINCPNLNVFHILVWHGGVVLVSSSAGALLGAAVEYLERRRIQKRL